MHGLPAGRAAQVDLADLAARVVPVQDGRAGLARRPPVAPPHHHQQQVAQLNRNLILDRLENVSASKRLQGVIEAGGMAGAINRLRPRRRGDAA